MPIVMRAVYEPDELDIRICEAKSDFGRRGRQGLAKHADPWPDWRGAG